MKILNKDELQQKAYDFIKGNLINLIVILTSFAYIFYGMVVIKRTDLSVWECVASAGIGIIVGFMIKQGLGENGFNKGYGSNIWKTNLEKYSKACNIANDYIERVDNFYAYEEIEKRKAYRRSNMMSAQMKYSWFFDKDGNYIDNQERYAKLTRYQKAILKKCVRVRIYNLNLFSEYSNEVSSYSHREKTDKDQRAKMFGKNGLAQVISAIFGAYFVAQWGNWNWGAFITATIQVAIWVSCGIMQLYTNYNYVVIEKVNKLTRKIELIVKFSKGCEVGMYKTSPYDEIEQEEYTKESKEVEYGKQERIFSETDNIPSVFASSTNNILEY